MQADYALCPDIMRACQDARRNAVNLADLWGKFPGRTDNSFVETRNLRSTTGNHPVDAIRYIRLSYPLAAERFLDRPGRPTDG